MIAFITTLFGGLQTIGTIISSVKEILAFVQANKDEKWFQDMSKLGADLRSAETDDQRKELAKRLRDIIINM